VSLQLSKEAYTAMMFDLNRSSRRVASLTQLAVLARVPCQRSQQEIRRLPQLFIVCGLCICIVYLQVPGYLDGWLLLARSYARGS